MRELAQVLAECLMDNDFTNVFTELVSSTQCSEPIVVRYCSFESQSIQATEERGIAQFEVLVVHDEDILAYVAAFACEHAIRGCERSGWNAAHEDLRIVRIEPQAPERLTQSRGGYGSSSTVSVGRDRSGRYVWKVPVNMTIARKL